jgi:hypothetical protein
MFSNIISNHSTILSSPFFAISSIGYIVVR